MSAAPAPSAPAPSAPAPSAPPEAAPRRPWYRNPWLWAALIAVLTLPALRPLLRRVPPPPPRLAALPAFQLEDERGRPFGSAELRGQVYVASFFFTRCPSVCPKLMHALHRLQRQYERYGVDVRLVSISVDPTHDTPAVLRAYAARHGADPRRWRFLTGPEERIRELVTRGFQTHLGRPERQSGGLIDIAHSAGLALVDQEGWLRGFYGTDADGLEEVLHRSIHVLLERRPP
ncbi:MAG: SCO family protein [Proteobacteria bacterium]|nr:SCO family protein [Pseudomonadota bacterium]